MRGGGDISRLRCGRRVRVRRGYVRGYAFGYGIHGNGSSQVYANENGHNENGQRRDDAVRSSVIFAQRYVTGHGRYSRKGRRADDVPTRRGFSLARVFVDFQRFDEELANGRGHDPTRVVFVRAFEFRAQLTTDGFFVGRHVVVVKELLQRGRCVFRHDVHSRLGLHNASFVDAY